MDEKTTCEVCGEGEEEDLILLCDKIGCKNEVHMFCLRPVVKTIPEGDWLCPQCDVLGPSTKIQEYIDQHVENRSQTMFNSAADYNHWLSLIQQQYIPFQEWKPSYNFQIVESEYDITSESLIGMFIQLYFTNQQQYHSGRIISRRFIAEEFRWEHLVQFKSGMDDRNMKSVHWIGLEEHSCILRGDLFWAKIPGHPWWPTQKQYRSGIELILKKVCNNEKKSEKEIKSINLFFFYEENFDEMSVEEAVTSLMPFTNRPKPTLQGFGKRASVAYALANVELEDQRAVRGSGARDGSDVAGVGWSVADMAAFEPFDPLAATASTGLQAAPHASPEALGELRRVVERLAETMAGEDEKQSEEEVICPAEETALWDEGEEQREEGGEAESKNDSEEVVNSLAASRRQRKRKRGIWTGGRTSRMRRRAALRGGAAQIAARTASPQPLPPLLQQRLEMIFSGLRDNSLLCLDRRYLQMECGLRDDGGSDNGVGLVAVEGSGDGEDLLPGLRLTLQPACFFAHLQSLAESAC